MSEQTRRRVLAGVGGGAAAVLLGGTGTGLAQDDRPGTGGLTTLKVAHMAPDAPNVDVFLNETLVLEDVPFGTVSGNLVLRPGRYEIQATPTGEALSQSVIDVTTDFVGRAFTAIATGEVSEENRPFYPLIHPTKMAPLPEGMSRIRVFHLSPDAPRVDVAPEGGDPLFTGIGYTQNRTAEIPAGDYTLEVRPAGTGDVVTRFNVSLIAGRIYTGYVVGYADPDEAPATENLDLITTVDGFTPTTEGGGGGDGGGNGGGDGDGGGGNGG